MRILVVYYSLTGNTAALAKRVADGCNADIEQIKDAKERAGGWAMLRSASEAFLRRPGVIQSTERRPAEYDLVILGTPVWAWTLCSPMRAYIDQHASSFNHVAFFCTEGGSGGQRAFRAMSELTGKRPVATLEVTEPEIKSGADRDKAKSFVDAIAGMSDRSDMPARVPP